MNSNLALPDRIGPAGFFSIIVIMLMLFTACEKAEKDDERPVINMEFEGVFPQNCDTVYTGEPFTFRAVFFDNLELGAFSLDIHQNFDHHAHSTDISDCPFDPVKTPVNPMLLIGQYEIPPGMKQFSAEEIIHVSGDADPGDYHLMIRLTDKTGWQAIKGISIKILERSEE